MMKFCGTLKVKESAKPVIHQWESSLQTIASSKARVELESRKPVKQFEKWLKHVQSDFMQTWPVRRIG